MAIRKLQYGYPYEGQEREEKRENQSPQGLEAASPLRPQVQRNPENITIKIQNRIPRLIFDKAVVCPEFELEDQRIGPIVIVRNMFRLAFLLNPPGPHIRRAHVESFVKGGTYEGLKSCQHNYGRNEQCRSVSIPPFSKGGAGGILNGRTPLPIGTYL